MATRIAAATGAWKLRRWDVAVTVSAGVGQSDAGALVKQLLELLHVDMPIPEQDVVMLSVNLKDDYHFNSLERLSNLCLEQHIWSAVYQISRARGKEMVVFVPSTSSAKAVRETIMEISNTVSMSVAIRREEFRAVPTILLNALVQSLFEYELNAMGCIFFGDKADRQCLLSSDIFNDDVPTVEVQQLRWSIDTICHAVVIHMICIPAVMNLKTLAPPACFNTHGHIDTDSPLHLTMRAHVLPRMSSCWIISRHNDPPLPFQQPTKHTQSPTTETEFRQYWMEVHGIRLPEHIGGYVRVRFTGQSVVTYPACCVASEWSVLQKKTRVEAMDTLRIFISFLREIFGEESVSVSSPDERVVKTISLLPATVYVDPASTHRESSQKDTMFAMQQTKRRLVSRKHVGASHVMNFFD